LGEKEQTVGRKHKMKNRSILKKRGATSKAYQAGVESIRRAPQRKGGLRERSKNSKREGQKSLWSAAKSVAGEGRRNHTVIEPKRKGFAKPGGQQLKE